MEDPVEISSCQTFDRSSIERWFAEGHTTCPMTNQVLISKEFRPNIILRRSIEEWKDRNTMVTIASLKPNLDFDEEQTVLYALNELLRLSEEKEKHRQWIGAEGYIRILVGLLGRNKPLIRNKRLALLCSLIKDNNHNKVSDNPKAAKDANEVLENLPYSEHNVVQMAQANYFKPLIQNLREGWQYILKKGSIC
jgi:hypothetical protein